MHVIEPTRYRPRRRHRSWKAAAISIPLLLIAAGAANYLRPLPTPVASLNLTLPAAAGTVDIAWPPDGQAAIAASGYGLLGTHGDSQPLATASIAKVITALCVLQKQPLSPGETGPTYTITDDDVQLYAAYVALNGSLIPVTAGEKLTEYQALQALMIPSANNIADSLARWVFGSQEAYDAYATTFLHQHGMNQTRIGADASGFDPDTTSTATDLTTLGLLALQNPVLMSIAGQKSATLPVVGVVNNYNTILGVNGITGLKTGNSDADPGAFLFTATAHVGEQEIPLTGTVMGAADLNSALRASTRLAANAQQGFEQLPVVTVGQSIGSLRAVWGATVPIAPARDLQIVRWKTTPLTESHQLDATVRQGTIGTLKIAAGQADATVDLRLKQPLPGPGFWWRLTRH